MLHAKADWQKNIVRNEGTEKKFPEHKDFIKNIFPTGNHFVYIIYKKICRIQYFQDVK